MSDRPDTCQYHLCEDAPDGGLSMPFGGRWYCMRHYIHMIESLHTEPDVIEGPGNE